MLNYATFEDRNENVSFFFVLTTDCSPRVCLIHSHDGKIHAICDAAAFCLVSAFLAPASGCFGCGSGGCCLIRVLYRIEFYGFECLVFVVFLPFNWHSVHEYRPSIPFLVLNQEYSHVHYAPHFVHSQPACHRFVRLITGSRRPS